MFETALAMKTFIVRRVGPPVNGSMPCVVFTELRGSSGTNNKMSKIQIWNPDFHENAFHFEKGKNRLSMSPDSPQCNVCIMITWWIAAADDAGNANNLELSDTLFFSL